VPALVCAAALALSACGSGGQTFGAEEFVAEANAEGANLVLGAPLQTSDPEIELYAVTIEEPPSAQAEQGAELGGEQGGGSLRVTESDDAAIAEFARCEQAADLWCYRAANIVLVFQPGSRPEALAGVANAVKGLKD
jgi:hypothetical protein